MKSLQVEDELEIRSLAAAYSDAVNRGDVDGMVGVYANDGILNVFGGPDIVGHAAIGAIFHQTMSAFHWIFQMTHSGVVRIEGNTARARFWVTENGCGKNDNNTLFMGLYQDEAVRTSAGWRFARRRLDRLYMGRPKFDGKSFKPPAYTNL